MTNKDLMYSEFEDEKGTDGFWDKAGEIAKNIGLYAVENNVDNNGAVYAEDYGQEVIYELLKGQREPLTDERFDRLCRLARHV